MIQKIQVYNNKSRTKLSFRSRHLRMEKRAWSGSLMRLSVCYIPRQAILRANSTQGLLQDEAQDHQQQDQQDKPKNAEVNSHTVGQDDVSITSPSTSLGSLDSISTVTAMVLLLETMDSISTMLVTNGMSHSCAWTTIKRSMT
jgi:hypothetical protein